MPPSPGERAGGMQRRVNALLWERGDHVDAYATRELRPAEVIVLVRYRDELAGRVLELGCGAGRLTGYLAALARETHGIDVSERMLAYSRRAYPAATFEQRDLRDVSAFGAGRFDAVVAAFSVLDVLDDPERRRVIADVREVLAPGGLLVMSAHNLDYVAPAALDQARSRSLRWLAANAPRVPRRMWNRRRLARFERREGGYAILNDPGHDYATLHYHVTRAEQARQLDALGFDLLECLALDGRAVPAGETASDSPELHYVARRRAS